MEKTDRLIVELLAEMPEKKREKILRRVSKITRMAQRIGRSGDSPQLPVPVVPSSSVRPEDYYWVADMIDQPKIRHITLVLFVLAFGPATAKDISRELRERGVDVSVHRVQLAASRSPAVRCVNGVYSAVRVIPMSSVEFVLRVLYNKPKISRERLFEIYETYPEHIRPGRGSVLYVLRRYPFLVTEGEKCQQTLCETKSKGLENGQDMCPVTSV